MPWNRERIVELLLEAGEIARNAKKELACELKSDRSIVTKADREIEGLLAAELERPDSGTYLIGEETIAEKGEAYLAGALAREAYVVDPIDGTAPYAHLLHNWGISIGLMEKGALTHGAVYLPDYGELVISDGPRVLEGTRCDGAWSWRELDGSARPLGTYGLLAVTQGIAKRGKVLLPNPVMVLGVAVVPMVGLLQGRFTGFLGSVKLWDIAGALPLLLRKGFSITVSPGGERRVVTDRVEARTYHLDSQSPVRWALRSDLLICRPEDEPGLRGGFEGGGLGPE
jgi:myo-inositol-1(or 4)-monophosphatase